MDRNFSTTMIGSMSPFSPRSRVSQRSITAPAFRKSSRLSVSGRSNQTAQVVLKTSQHQVERFGQPLPVQITEALTFAERNTAVSVRISSECGYAWLVCGRRLLIWQYKQSPTHPQTGTPRRAALSNQCYELQLPQSDLAHRAELVAVFVSNNTFPSCITASPEGLVRYWPVIAHEGMSIEQQIDLQGQECDSLTNVEGLGCILATTTCTIVLVQKVELPRHSLVCHILKMPSGWLGGISKKMSSFIFGPISADSSTETRLVRVLSVPLEVNTWNIYVLAGHSLQKWKLSLNEPEEFVYATDLTRTVKDSFFSAFWENCGRDQNDVESWVLDFQPDSNGLIVLAAAVNLPISFQIHYALLHFDTNHSTAQCTSFNILKFSGIYAEEKPSESLGFRFLHLSGTSFVYNHRCVTVVKPHEDHDCLDFADSLDFILGGSICVNTPVFFTRINGLVALSSNETDLNASNVSSGTPLETSYFDAGNETLLIHTFNPEELQAAYKDTLGQLRTAFVYHVKGQFAPRNEIISSSLDLRSMDKYVLELSFEMLNDVPANDPRWQDKPVGFGSSFLMQVAQQLGDKQKTHAMFIQFLRESDLWKKLEFSIIRGSPMLTAYVLAENSEKIVAAIALKSRASDEVLQNAMEAAVAHADIPLEKGLTCQNVLYCRLKNFQNIFIELANICDFAAHSDKNPQEIAVSIRTSNDIIIDVLKQVLNYRQSNADFFEPAQPGEYLLWTAASGPEGLMDSLVLMQDLTYKYGAKGTAETNLQNELYEQLVALIDIILDARKTHLESISKFPNKETMLKQYCTDRRRFIEPLIREEQWEGAALLAEKYLDFESLVIICEKTNNQQRLDMYMDRFKEQNFTEFVCNWLVQENKQGKLIELCGRKESASEITHNFLTAHPNLSWIQNIRDRNFQEAASVLNSLALKETDSLSRQKTMLSLAKLSAITDQANPQVIADIDTRLELISYQEEVPDYVLQQFGYNNLKPGVIPVKDLIHLYTCLEYKDATEYDFKKALDLLKFIPDEDLRQQLSLKIWVNAILRDSWSDSNLDSPLEILQKKLMFKIVDLALVLGTNHSALLPPINDILHHPDLQHLHDNHIFEYLIKTGYEHFSRIMMMDS